MILASVPLQYHSSSRLQDEHSGREESEPAERAAISSVKARVALILDSGRATGDPSLTFNKGKRRNAKIQ